MKLNGDEKRIQQLFRDMSWDEQQLAPKFGDVLAKANSGTISSRSRGLMLRLAMAVAVLFAVLLITTAVILRPSEPGGDGDPQQASAPTLQRADPDNIDSSRPNVRAPNAGAPRKSVAKRARRRRSADEIAPVTQSLFAWQSPTTSLLTMPDDKLLNSLPRLGDSLETIKNYLPDQFN